MQLGRFVERAQQVAAVLLAQTDADMGASVEQSESDWVTLLRAHHAYEEYTRAYGVAARPEPALDLLVTDPLLPNSICRSLDRAELELAALGAAPDAAAAAAVRRLSGRLRALAHYEWPDRDDRTELLRRIDAHCRELHDLITLTYLSIPSPGRRASKVGGLLTGLVNRQSRQRGCALIHGEVPVRKGVPAGGDIAAAGGSRWAVAGRLSLGRRLLFGGLDDGRLAVDG